MTDVECTEQNNKDNRAFTQLGETDKHIAHMQTREKRGEAEILWWEMINIQTSG